MNASFVISSPDVSQCPAGTLPEYAFIGRSNVGKSSLINMLCRDPHLAKTSQKPGKTLLINHFLIESDTAISSAGIQSKRTKWHLVDLPGYGYAQTGLAQRDQLRRMIERYCLMRVQLVCLFVLIDSRLNPQKIDLEFMQWLGENEVPFSIVFTKADKLGKGRLSENMAVYKQTLLETWEELPLVFCTSSETGMGRDELLSFISQCNANLPQE
ncbi:MAG: YihA family ribosome biogenesis GTP-binding protein [Paludibacteraceae bacterium]|nr:YihA family ribosome biogenesis GTP-binding protein [Paludibacteraceae bacterium]